MMKRLLICAAALLLLASRALAQGIELPYGEFVRVYDGDRIDFNGDGESEQLCYRIDEDSMNDYFIQVGDSLPVASRDVYRGVCGYIDVTEDMEVYAVRMGDSMDDRTFLLVCSGGDDCWMFYDVFQVIETERITPWGFENREVVVAQTETPIRDEQDGSRVLGSLEAGDYAFYDNDWKDSSGEVWCRIEIADDVWGCVAEKDVQRMCRGDYFGAWTVRFVGTIECYGGPESLRVEDGRTISNFNGINGLGSQQLIRQGFYIYSKDWTGWDWDRDNRFIGGVFAMDPGCMATWPEVFARAEQEIPLYSSRTGDGIGDVLQPGDVVLSYMTDGNGRFYLREYSEDPWDSDFKRGWIELDANNNLVLPGKTIAQGTWGDVREYFTGLIYGG